MTVQWHLAEADEPALVRLAELFALKLRPGDTLALHGDLGAGKTTFARALIRAVLADADADVPSPTFSIVQTYDTPRLPLAHIDLYRLSGEDEARELGIEDLLRQGAIIVEWPERAPSLSGVNRLDVTLLECADADRRHVAIDAHGTWEPRLQRLQAIAAFLDAAPMAAGASLSYLQGDASARAYARLTGASRPLVLMDWPPQPDGPPILNGLSYSRIAHLAEGTPAFASVAGLINSAGLTVPHIHAADHVHGLLLIEDLGDRVFGAEIQKGASLEPLWRAATDTLVALRRLDSGRIAAWNAGPGSAAPIGTYDRGALEIEISLLPGWYWPLIKGSPVPADIRRSFENAWRTVIGRLLADPSRCLTLRDFHSPNLIWLPERGPDARQHVGLIDFQDALLGPPAFDLVSLMQDARLDVPPEIEGRLYRHYAETVTAADPQFDEATFRFAYAALGAQRNTKILGIFARLCQRDGKPQYLRHIPRIWAYLERDLAHPDLASLKDWYDRHFPASDRTLAPKPERPQYHF